MIFATQEAGPKIVSRNDDVFKFYTDPTQSDYLCYSIDDVVTKDFKMMSWCFRELSAFKNLTSPTMPFAVCLTELMKVKMK